MVRSERPADCLSDKNLAGVRNEFVSELMIEQAPRVVTFHLRFQCSEHLLRIARGGFSANGWRVLGFFPFFGT
jgi:hypothetical protein